MSKIKLGISIGDINGIGLEIIMKTFKDIRMLDFCTPIIFGSSKIASIYRKAIQIKGFNFNIINNIIDINPKKVNLLNIWNKEIEVNFGKPTAFSAELSFHSLKKASEALHFLFLLVLGHGYSYFNYCRFFIIIRNTW